MVDTHDTTRMIAGMIFLNTFQTKTPSNIGKRITIMHQGSEKINRYISNFESQEDCEQSNFTVMTMESIFRAMEALTEAVLMQSGLIVIVGNLKEPEAKMIPIYRSIYGDGVIIDQLKSLEKIIFLEFIIY